MSGQTKIRELRIAETGEIQRIAYTHLVSTGYTDLRHVSCIFGVVQVVNEIEVES